MWDASLLITSCGPGLRSAKNKSHAIPQVITLLISEINNHRYGASPLSLCHFLNSHGRSRRNACQSKMYDYFQQEIAPQGENLTADPTCGSSLILHPIVPFFFTLCLSSETSVLQYLLLCLLQGKMNHVINPWTLAIIFHAAGACPYTVRKPERGLPHLLMNKC